MATRVHDLRAGRRILELDGLRGIAVSLVVLLHYVVRPASYMRPDSPAAALPLMLRNVVEISWCGVDLFFVLSGFLIGGILLDHREAPNRWRAFYARRVFRIFPAYFLLVLLAFVPFLGGASHLGRPTPLFAYALFIQNFWLGQGYDFMIWLGPVWSLAIEEQFYVVAPLLIARLSSRWLLSLLAAAILGALALRSISLFWPRLLPFHINAWDFTLCRFDGISMGVVAAWLVRQPRTLSWLTQRVSFLKVLSGIISVAIIGLVQIDPSDLRENLTLSLGLSLLAALASCLVLLAILEPAGWFSTVLRTRPLTAIGKHSYFIYLFHILVLTLTDVLTTRFWWRILIALVALWPLALASWHWFEMPLIRRGRSVSYEPAAEAPLAVATES